MDRCCGLDVHKDSIFACILDTQCQKILKQRYGTTACELTRLRDTMENTSIY
jgi:hypothetical protein